MGSVPANSTNSGLKIIKNLKVCAYSYDIGENEVGRVTKAQATYQEVLPQFYLCAHVCVCVHLCVGVYKIQKKVLALLELELPGLGAG